ncbi:hypothetical protein LZ30DRAFT_707208 [Colletotrichum cereale]|nr:hypothetical protein LZ30DRAFT_707208 [Colletotrichum cereale]
MPLITELPCELVACILRSLDDIQSLTPALLSCRHIYTSFKQSPGIEAEIIRRHVTPALTPYSVAVAEASRLPRPREGVAVQLLLNTLYNEPAQLAARLPSMPTALLQKMARTHSAIHSAASKFATEAWRRLHRDEEASTFTSVTLSPTEYFRFCRAFYRVDLFYSLFSEEMHIVNGVIQSSALKEGMNPWFFLRHTPWENEQIGCAHDYLEAELAKASFEVVAHDVNFGEFSIDYLTDGEENNYRQLWLSQGIDVFHRLTCETSYDKKKELLPLYSTTGDTNLPSALYDVLGNRAEVDTLLGAHTEEDILSVMPEHKNEEDADRGPHESWYAAHIGIPLTGWLMLQDNGWLRDRAYVFWDWDRIERHHLLEVFQSSSDISRPGYSDQEWQEMQESFDERSLIWQKGGSGYWSKGDVSRVEWPKK